MSKLPDIKSRKQLHLKYAISEESQAGSTGLEQVKLPYHALGGKNLEKIDISIEFLGKTISAPFFISCMTGGPDKASLINQRLAKAAQKYQIPMGLGSLRIVLKHPETLPTFQVRKYAPDIPLMANLGAVSLNYGLTTKDCQKVVDLVEADALVLHLNPLQEVLQLGGDTDFTNLLPKIEKVIKNLTVPVIIKEVGHGIDYQTAKQLFEIGIKIIDTAGVGGTSWAWIEAEIAGDKRKAQIFKDYGISTYDSIQQCVQAVDAFQKSSGVQSSDPMITRSTVKNRHPELDSGSQSQTPPGNILKNTKKSSSSKVNGINSSKLTILGSGGIRTGLDIAKCLHMGCHMAGLARPFLLAALQSQKAVEELVEELAKEVKIANFIE